MSALSGLEECNLHKRTPYGFKAVSKSQLSVAIPSGGMTSNGEFYIYLRGTDELVRSDVWAWKRRQTGRTKKKQNHEH